MSGRVTPKMREALSMIRNYGIVYVGDPNFYGVVTSGPSFVADGQAWINWRTAEALERAGLARVEGYGEECEIIVEPSA